MRPSRSGKDEKEREKERGEETGYRYARTVIVSLGKVSCFALVLQYLL